MNSLTNEELRKAAQMITRLAEFHGVSESEVRADLLTAMKAGINNSDPAVQEHWRSFSFAGTEPTVEEFLAWVLVQSISATGK